MSSDNTHCFSNWVLVITSCVQLISIFVCPGVILPAVVTGIPTWLSVTQHFSGSAVKIVDFLAAGAWLWALAVYDKDTGGTLLLVHIMSVVQMVILLSRDDNVAGQWKCHDTDHDHVYDRCVCGKKENH